jgi:hypothetical protein
MPAMLKILFDRYLRAGFLWAWFPDAGLPGVWIPGVGIPGVGIDFFNAPLSSQKRIVAVIAVACAIFQASAILGFAQEVAQGPEQIAKWVAELGNPKFEVRDQATGRLSGLSTDQLELLQTMQASASDPEVRVRLGSVIAKLKSERQQQIIGVFLRDPTMQEDHGLKGWNSFAKVAGATRSSKRLFLQLYERHAELVEKYGPLVEKDGDWVDTKKQRWRRRGRVCSLSTTAVADNFNANGVSRGALVRTIAKAMFC